MGFGERLRSLRRQVGLSQAELARVLSLDKSSVSRYEAGEREPSHAVLHKIADYFGVSVDYLLRGDTADYDPGPLSKLPARLREFVSRDIEDGAMYLKVLAQAADHGVSAEGLMQLLDALIAATETSRKVSRPNK